MKILPTLALITSLFIATSASANCNTYECKKKATLADKTISEPVKKELREYYEKSDKLHNECKDKRKELKNSLSEDASKAMSKHHKRHKKQSKATAKGSN